MTPNTTTPLKTFHPFPNLPAEIRYEIWTLALLSPLSSSPTTSQKPQLPPLHIRPFSTLPAPNPAQETLLSDIPTRIQAEHGPAWRESVLADHLPKQAAETCKDALARCRASRTTLIPPGGKGVGRYDAGGFVKREVEGVASSCEEARRVLEGLVRRFGGVEGWLDMRPGGGGVCCFWDVGVEFGELGVGEHGHPRLVPSISFEDAKRLDDGKAGEDIAMLRGLEGLAPATAYCEVLAAVWSPKMCMDFLVPELELPPECVEFKKDLMGLVSRHPKLYTLYLVDPSVQSSGLCVPSGSVLKFCGDAALFYELDPAHPDGGWQQKGARTNWMCLDGHGS
ncbi:hypothetical protein C8A01DRAFT_40778 [Parachaetomium inaequale]|uniref:2EXR domain-containing protein n=1 Tax=Parachaetomium inaequale TaxID=2588326 RepID=A0AAN6PB63_9PEZI|nr:hypothetical protein C8A01DRAFT_40778 [Parachaetomium inaequale]